MTEYRYLHSPQGKEIIEVTKVTLGQQWFDGISDSELEYFVEWVCYTGRSIDAGWLADSFRGFVKGLEYIKESKKS